MHTIANEKALILVNLSVSEGAKTWEAAACRNVTCVYLSGVDVEQLGRLSGGLESVVVTSQQQAGGLQGQSHALQLGVVRTTNQLQHGEYCQRLQWWIFYIQF